MDPATSLAPSNGSSSDSPSVYDITGLIFSTIGLIVLFQMGYELIHDNLPEQRMKELNNILSETDILFRLAVQDGILTNEGFRLQIENRLLDLNAAADKARAEVYTAIDIWQQLRAMLSGLSRTIGGLIKEVEELRATVTLASEHERERLERSGLYRQTLAHPVDLTYPSFFPSGSTSSGTYPPQPSSSWTVPSAVVLASGVSTTPAVPPPVATNPSASLTSPPAAYLASAAVPSTQPMDMRFPEPEVYTNGISATEAREDLERVNRMLHPYARISDTGHDPRKIKELLELLYSFNENVRTFHVVADQNRRTRIEHAAVERGVSVEEVEREMEEVERAAREAASGASGPSNSG